MITNSTLRLVSPQGKLSYVIEDHAFADGHVMRVEAYRLSDANHRDAMLTRVPQLEVQRADAIVEASEQELLRAANGKVVDYIRTVDPTTLKLTAEEDAVFAKANEITRERTS